MTGDVTRSRAIRATAAGTVQGVGFRETVRRRAGELGIVGWVRNEYDGSIAVHAEGPNDAIATLIDSLREGPPSARVSELTVRDTSVEGHEQFAIRGVPAGVFVVQQHSAPTRHFDLRVELTGLMRSWTLPKGPSLDPAVKRLALDGGEHRIEHNDCEGVTAAGDAIVWDRGQYEQGGRVPWPQALERGHAVFVLHGEKLRGGFALQRTRAGANPGWLLIKRRDEDARPGSDIVAERPASVLSGHTLDELLDART